jgi:hypothetical protein
MGKYEHVPIPYSSGKRPQIENKQEEVYINNVGAHCLQGWPLTQIVSDLNKIRDSMTNPDAKNDEV